MSLEQVESLRTMLLARRSGPPLSLEQRRAGFEAQMAMIPLSADAVFTSDPELPGLWVDLPGGDSSAAILWLHGGAFVLGSSASYRDFGCRLAASSGVRVFLLDYRLSPEHVFPAALDDSDAALDRLTARGLKLAVGGDSAGGNLAVAAIQARIAKGQTVPDACLLVSPYLDLTHIGNSAATRAHLDPFVDPATMTATAATYHGDADPADPRVSPLFGAINGFPPTLIQVGSDEVLFDDAKRFADRLLDVVFQEWVGMIHVWPLFAIDEGDWAIVQIGSFVQRQLLQT